MSEPKRLVRPKQGAILAGVCAGLADYMGIDVTVVRVVWVLLTIFTAFFPGVIAYVILWVMVPNAPEAPPTEAVPRV